MKLMGQNIFFQYAEWHFMDTPRGILGAWKNCLKFNLNCWSVITLIKTFFSHWHRYRYSYGRGFDFKRYFEVFTFNMISRVSGAIFRSFLIVIGLTTEIFIVFMGLIVFLFWLALPILIILGLWFGINLLL